MTPEEAAALTKAVGDTTSDEKASSFRFFASARDIQKFIHLIRMGANIRYLRLARVALDIRLAEDADLVAKQLTKQTDRLIRFTIGLYVFTIVIAGFAAIQILIMLVDYCSKNN